MRQRNDTPHAWSFAATPATDDTPEQPPFVVEPGETTDRPNLLDGWTAVDEPEPDSSQDSGTTASETGDASTTSENAAADSPPARTPSRTKRAAAADTDKDGGEPQ